MRHSNCIAVPASCRGYWTRSWKTESHERSGKALMSLWTNSRRRNTRSLLDEQSAVSGSVLIVSWSRFWQVPDKGQTKRKSPQTTYIRHSRTLVLVGVTGLEPTASTTPKSANWFWNVAKRIEMCKNTRFRTRLRVETLRFVAVCKKKIVPWWCPRCPDSVLSFP